MLSRNGGAYSKVTKGLSVKTAKQCVVDKGLGPKGWTSYDENK